MNSHFSVILLCFSGVYCISSTVDNLDLDGLKQILKGETIVKEWDTALDQTVIPKGSKTPVNVKNAVQEFAKKDDDSAVREFESIRNIIQTAHQCMLAKYASLTAFLIVEDLENYKIDITDALAKLSVSKFDRQTSFKDVQSVLHQLDVDVKFGKNAYQFLPHHDFQKEPYKQIHNVWADMLEKKLGLKIKYKIYPDVMANNFTSTYDDPTIANINELSCVLNEAIQMVDNVVVENCGNHEGNFVENFQSLKTSTHEDFIWLLTYCDAMKAGDPNLALYTDFSKPSPEATQESDEILASGCFIEKMEFEISGLRTDFQNTNDPAKMYGQDIVERSETLQMTLIESTRDARPIEDNSKDKVKVGMVLFRDEENSFEDLPSQRQLESIGEADDKHTPEDQHDESGI
ncbi:uncharacterized protein LOC126843736 [Adelges cooleyi]|uniref:uncharacterized protein LOC126843736 n=1 Tax=Adelges cooleyi TaxID=133065 RepID=UPI00217FBC85|nr:uncharacterized protein LOC126843736 [Adelges cooleyi]